MFGGIRPALLTLALAAPRVLSFVITGPTANSYPALSALTISWMTESGDPSQFGLELIGDTSTISIATNVDASQSSFSFIVPNNTGDYTMAFVDTSGSNRVFTT
ncbi:hypothetical protein FB45DRAFT_466545 [Roridomyces roridus]|uniref:Yeast cell wall synthesis Kre9/Knh1-like N-terminal domain-containing protein n=1 Tax=Roridomyces roridus TaxID=1738132 RepID=A0AAD7BYJ4_9AGAR|nr:hypothetical protein FB45DRAFT_466545 [Roridomyces roridus]